MSNINPTPSELAILQILWANGPSSVKTVHEELQKEKDAGYTTTLKLMQIMSEKGLLTRKMEGRYHVYEALISEDYIQEALLDKFMNATFRGSALKMVMKALGNNKTSKEELDEIRDYINQIKNNEDDDR